MKTYTLTIVTSFYKTVTVQANNEDEARDAAWDWCEENDAMYKADVDTNIYDIEEVTA